VLESLAVFAI